jgi:hypothetical protein
MDQELAQLISSFRVFLEGFDYFTDFPRGLFPQPGFSCYHG